MKTNPEIPDYNTKAQIPKYTEPNDSGCGCLLASIILFILIMIAIFAMDTALQYGESERKTEEFRGLQGTPGHYRQ